MDTWWDFALAAALLAEHGWLLILNHRLAIVHRRLSLHICRDPVPLPRSAPRIPLPTPAPEP